MLEWTSILHYALHYNTYIDEEQPSRLDFGKHKFGGPFTEEEVEDVKTIFLFLPLVAVVFAPGLLYNQVNDQFYLHAILATTVTLGCVKRSKLKVYYMYVVSFIFILVYCVFFGQ